MLEKILIIIAAAIQSHSTTIGLYALGKSVEESLVLVAIGASVGITVLFYIPDALLIIIGWIRQFIYGKYGNKERNGRRYSKIRLLQWRQKLVEKIEHSKYPYVAVFIAAAIPLPIFPQAAMVAAKVMGLKSGFKLIFIGNLINVSLLVAVVYHLGNLIVR